MSAPLRVGVVGLGWAGRQHMDAWHTHPDAVLVAIAGQEDALRDELGAQYGLAPSACFADWQALIDGAGELAIDVVSVATPTGLHAPITIAALDAAMHVLCEKPMAESADAAAAMVAAAERNERVLDVSFNHRRRGNVRALKALVDSGVFGRIYYAKTGWLRRQGIPGMGTWFTRKELAGGGPMMDLGVHMLDMALYLLGEPAGRTVSASAYAEFGPRGLGGWSFQNASAVTGGFDVEDLATAFVRLDDGATLLLESSWAQWIPHDRCYVELYGTERGARLEWGGPSAGGLEVWTAIDGVPATLAPQIGADGEHRACIADFVTTIRGVDHAAHRGHLALRRAAIVDAAYRSAELGAEVALDG